MYGVLMLLTFAAIAVTSLRWIAAKEDAAQKAYESDGK